MVNELLRVIDRSEVQPIGIPQDQVDKAPPISLKDLFNLKAWAGYFPASAQASYMWKINQAFVQTLTYVKSGKLAPHLALIVILCKHYVN